MPTWCRRLAQSDEMGDMGDGNRTPNGSLAIEGGPRSGSLRHSAADPSGQKQRSASVERFPVGTSPSF